MALSDRDLVYAAIARIGRGGGARPRGMLRLVLRHKTVSTASGRHEHLLLTYSRFPFVLRNYVNCGSGGLPTRAAYRVSACLTRRSGATQAFTHVWRMLNLPSYREKFHAVT